MASLCGSGAWFPTIRSRLARVRTRSRATWRITRAGWPSAASTSLRTLVDISPRPREGWGAPNSDDPKDVNRKRLDGVWRYVAAMKKEGIYSLICPYWALTVKPPKGLGR
jgi:hypothetical protein